MLGGFDSALNVAADTLGLLRDPARVGGPGTSLEIQEIGGSRIVLTDRSVPFQDVEFGVEQRSKKTIYPGNPRATIQILGNDNMPTELSGEWNYRFFLNSILVNGDPSVIKTPAQCCDVFDKIARSGRGIRVQWLHYVRYGILKRFVPTWVRSTDVKWQMAFEWLAADDDRPAKANLPGSGFGISDFMKALNFLEDCIVLGPWLVRSFSASLVSTIKSIREKVSLVVQAFGAIEALVNLPAAVLGAIDAAIKSICDEVSEMIRRVSSPRISARQAEIAVIAAAALSQDPSMPSANSGVAASDSAATQHAKLESWARTVAQAASILRHQAIVIGNELHARARPEAAKKVTLAEGETIWGIAAREYGSAEYANYLIQINHLQSATPPPGTTLQIPQRPFGAAPDLELSDTDIIDLSNPVACQV